MKIAILTSGILPVPAVRGGAVENLIDFYLEYNDRHRLHDITVYSVFHPDVENHEARRSAVNHYHYIDVSSPWAKVRKKFYQLTHGRQYYHYTIEYFLQQALHHINRQGYDLVVLENRPGYALSMTDMSQTRLVYHLHNDILNSATLHSKELYDAAWRIVSVSDFITSRVRTINVQDDKCLTVLNGINLQAFSPAGQGGGQPDDSTFNLIFTGRIIPEKGLMPLLKAMKLLRDYSDIKLTVLGGASLGSNQGTSPFLRQLHEVARDLSKVIFTGYVDYAKMADYLHASHVAVLPSLWDEPFGLTCAEALACGLPLITTRQGGIPEVADDECAIMLEADERLPQRLADAILYLRRHPGKRQQMALHALERSQLFSKTEYAKNFFEAIETR